MESLPADIVQEILSRVPAESVLECKLVCKKWVTLIRGRYFTDMQLNHQLNHLHCGEEDRNAYLAAKVESCLFFACRIIDHHRQYRTLLYHGGKVSDRISLAEKYIYNNQNLKRIYHPLLHTELLSGNLVGSVNGLVCALQFHNTILDPTYIFNPFTREYVYLPQLVVKIEDVGTNHGDLTEEGEVNMFYHTACGFGYLRSTYEYKVVRIRYLDEYYEEGHVEVYTLGSGYGWRSIGKLYHCLDVTNGGRGTYANDAIYWISHQEVVAFDLANEEFRLAAVPPCIENVRNGHAYGLVTLGTNLCYYWDDKLRVKIWSLNKCGDSKETWRMEFDIDYQATVGTRKRRLQPILLTKNGEIILLYADSVIYSYDTKTSVLKMISNEASTNHLKALEAIAHVNTFASLEAMGENSKRYTFCSPSDDVIGDLDRVALHEGIDMTRFRLRIYPMESLPSDVVQEILSWVPAESVLVCKLVCKKWATLIRGSNFAKMHLTRLLNCLHGGDNINHSLSAKVEPGLFFACTTEGVPACTTLLYHGGQVSDRISNDEKYSYSQDLKRIYHPLMHDEALTDYLVGSCNGLVCAFQVHHTVIDPIYICNPLTREYIYLPELVVKKEDVHPDLLVEGEVDMYNFTACGFGYVRSTSEYKVIRIHYVDYRLANVEIYTLGSGCGWRAIGRVSYQLNTTRGGRGIYVNDAIYWTSGNKVVMFDLAEEEFQLVPVPSRMENRRIKDICGLVALRRHLCLYIDDKIHVQIWSLTDSSDSEETGCLKFDINYQALPDTRSRWIQPILLTMTGEIIFLYAESVLYCYDPKTTVLKMISDEASTDYFDTVDAIAHISTFASLEAMGENSKRYTVRSPLDDVIDELDRVALGEEVETTRL